MTEDWLIRSLSAPESERLEFKSVVNQFPFEDVCRYCVALGNEGGGYLVLGVSNKRRAIEGTKAFPNIKDASKRLLDTLNFRVDVVELSVKDRRVVVFRAPPRPVGHAYGYRGAYWMRAGESLVPMTAERLAEIFRESEGPDYSALTYPGGTLDDLHHDAIEQFRRRWAIRSGKGSVLAMSVEQLLEDSELTVDGRPTIAALVLLGKAKAVGRHLANSEVVWEYRATEERIEFSKREEFREGFLTFHDKIWERVNDFNTVTSLREGFFRREIPAFNEDAVREAILNAICHRDYRHGGSVFVRQYPTRLQVTSPGGFPDGIDANNVVRKQFPRNRRLAEACGKCGLVERAGQGMDKIFDSSLREGKGNPDFAGTDASEVVLTLPGEVIDQSFVSLIEIAEERNIPLHVEHLMTLDQIRRGVAPSSEANGLVNHLVRIGLVETIRKGRKQLLILSRSMSRYLGEAGTYTRESGLTRPTYKELLKKAIENCGEQGASLNEFRQVLPMISDRQIRDLLEELKAEGALMVVGRTRAARWFLK